MLIHGNSSLESKFSSSLNFDDIKGGQRSGARKVLVIRGRRFCYDGGGLIGEIKIDILPRTVARRTLSGLGFVLFHVCVCVCVLSLIHISEPTRPP